MNGKIEAKAKPNPITGLYQTHANPMTRRLRDMETDIVRDSMAIIPHKTFEFKIIVFRIFAKQVAARNIINQPNPLKKSFRIIDKIIKYDVYTMQCSKHL